MGILIVNWERLWIINYILALESYKFNECLYVHIYVGKVFNKWNGLERKISNPENFVK